MPSPHPLAKLRRELATLEQRYGPAPDPRLESLESSLRRRVGRIDELTDRIDELIDELAVLERERDGLVTGMTALVAERIEEIRRRHGEGWSPVPIHAFRAWDVSADGLHGAAERWEGPVKQATCSKLTRNADVPHTDIGCNRPRCGVYAVKDIGQILDGRTGDGTAVGVVAMTGKVVEHEHGYRAATAEAVALSATWDGRTLTTDDPDLVAVTFAAPTDAIAGFGEPSDGWPAERIAEFLESAERRRRWTSDENCA